MVKYIELLKAQREELKRREQYIEQLLELMLVQAKEIDRLRGEQSPLIS